MSGLSPSQSRNLWPAGIIGTFVVFIAGTAGLVVLSARNNVELVRADYYEQELRFQEQINQRARTQALPQSVRVTYDAAERRLRLALPAAHAAAHATGEIHLYRPSNAELDRRVSLQLDAQGRQSLDTTSLSEGLWRIRVNWRVGSDGFAFEEEVVVGAAAPKPGSAASQDSQIRNPKSEIRGKREIQNAKHIAYRQTVRCVPTNRCLRVMGFELRTCFGFRISDFGFPPATGRSNPAPYRSGENRRV